MFNIISHQGNANLNSNDSFSPWQCQMWWEPVSIWHSYRVEVLNNPVIMENCYTSIQTMTQLFHAFRKCLSKRNKT